MKTGAYKKCPGCGRKFTLRQIAEDPNIIPIGMSTMTEELDSAYFYFQHNVPDCNSSFLVKVKDFHDFVGHNGQNSSNSMRDCCGGQCVSLRALRECRFSCGFEPYRKFLFKMIENKKHANKQESADKKFSL